MVAVNIQQVIQLLLSCTTNGCCQHTTGHTATVVMYIPMVAVNIQQVIRLLLSCTYQWLLSTYNRSYSYCCHVHTNGCCQHTTGHTATVVMYIPMVAVNIQQVIQLLLSSTTNGCCQHTTGHTATVVMYIPMVAVNIQQVIQLLLSCTTNGCCQHTTGHTATVVMYCCHTNGCCQHTTGHTATVVKYNQWLLSTYNRSYGYSCHVHTNGCCQHTTGHTAAVVMYIPMVAVNIQQVIQLLLSCTTNGCCQHTTGHTATVVMYIPMVAVNIQQVIRLLLSCTYQWLLSTYNRSYSYCCHVHTNGCCQHTTGHTAAVVMYIPMVAVNIQQVIQLLLSSTTNGCCQHTTGHTATVVMYIPMVAVNIEQVIRLLLSCTYQWLLSTYNRSYSYCCHVQPMVAVNIQQVIRLLLSCTYQWLLSTYNRSYSYCCQVQPMVAVNIQQVIQLLLSCTYQWLLSTYNRSYGYCCHVQPMVAVNIQQVIRLLLYVHTNGCCQHTTGHTATVVMYNQWLLSTYNRSYSYCCHVQPMVAVNIQQVIQLLLSCTYQWLLSTYNRSYGYCCHVQPMVAVNIQQVIQLLLSCTYQWLLSTYNRSYSYCCHVHTNDCCQHTTGHTAAVVMYIPMVAVNIQPVRIRLLLSCTYQWLLSTYNRSYGYCCQVQPMVAVNIQQVIQLLLSCTYQWLLSTYNRSYSYCCHVHTNGCCQHTTGHTAAVVMYIPMVVVNIQQVIRLLLSCTYQWLLSTYNRSYGYCCHVHTNGCCQHTTGHTATVVMYIPMVAVNIQQVIQLLLSCTYQWLLSTYNRSYGCCCHVHTNAPLPVNKKVHYIRL